MLISLLVLLLFSNAVILRRDKSILFSRIVIVGLLLTSFLSYANLYVRPLDIAIGTYVYLFNISTYIQTFVFIFILSAVKLILTACFLKIMRMKTIGLVFNILPKTLTIQPENIVISSSLSSIIYIIALLLSLFIYVAEQWFSVVSILTFYFSFWTWSVTLS